MSDRRINALLLGAIVLGLLGRARAEGRGAATAAVALGLLATFGGVVALVLDQTS